MENKMEMELSLRLSSFLFFVRKQKESNCGVERVALLLMGTASSGKVGSPIHISLFSYLQIHRMDYCSRKIRNSFEMNHGIRDREEGTAHWRLLLQLS
jgi:hypothetical protein